MKGAIYLIKSSGLVKIGYSKNPWKRYRQLCTGASSPMALVFTLYSADARGLEGRLHKAFAEKRKHGEWFDVSVNDVLIWIGLNEKSRKGKIEPKATDAQSLKDQSPLASEEEMKEFFRDMAEMLGE